LRLQVQALWALILLSIMAMRALLSGGGGELGSVVLTFIYGLGYFAISSLLERGKNKRMFVQNMMRRLIFAFAILSVVQMMASFTGLPIPNLIGSKGLWSYNSLAYEPSQLGRVVGISMLCYLMLDRLSGVPEHPGDTPQTRQKVWIAFVLSMLLSGSALATVAIGVAFVMSRALVWVFVIVASAILLWPMALFIDYEPLQRVVLLISNLGSFDLDLLYAADGSGAVRIAPVFIYLSEASAAEFGFWFGYGDGGLTRFFLGRLLGVGDTVTVGFLPGFMVIYGIFSSALFIWVFALRQANRTTLPLIGFWVIFMSSSAWNTQVFWYGLVIIQIAYLASREDAQDPMVVRA